MRTKLVQTAILVCLIIATYVYTVPNYYFPAQGKMDISRVTYRSPDGKESEISDSIDMDQLEHDLHMLESKRGVYSFSSYALTDVQYEIDGISEGKPFHILLGNADTNCVYESAEKGGHTIVNQDKWINTLETLRQDSTAGSTSASKIG